MNSRLLVIAAPTVAFACGKPAKFGAIQNSYQQRKFKGPEDSWPLPPFHALAANQMLLIKSQGQRFEKTGRQKK
jgi:hypothetical protein